MAFVRVDLVKQFAPRQDARIYAMDQLLDMAKWPRARGITFYAVFDSNVNAVVSVRVVANDGPDPGGGIVNLGEVQQNIANKYSKLAFSINMASAPFPFYGMTFDTTPAAPSAGLCWAYADIWWGE